MQSLIPVRQIFAAVYLVVSLLAAGAGYAQTVERDAENASAIRDLTINGVACKVESFLMNQDRTQPPPAPGSGVPPEPPGPSEFADLTTRDEVRTNL